MIEKNLSTVGLLAAFCLVAAPLQSTEVRGHVHASGQAAPPNTTIIVFAESLEGEGPIHPGRYKMVQRNKAFVPHVLAVPVGSTIDFPNEDAIFHNVFSSSRPGPFDLGLYRAGASKSRAFREPATYRVFCNIHSEMTALILVLPTSYITELDASGNYRFDLPPGRYQITVWSERAQPATTEVAVAANPVKVLDLTPGPAVAEELPHKNKYGQNYSRGAYDPLKPK